MTQPSVPESVSRDAVVDFCKSLGLDPSDVQGLEFSPYGLYVTFFALNATGHKISDGRDAATHRSFVQFGEEASDDDRAAPE
ncbi:hypothetical protein [Streptomyces asiaticus]|uniref:hypothetical protein n=1 Tax=Streptomyces asiaticus TaxID=114695 RepID=UPI001BA8652C|nr:hypothetical protein [Streptomyces asiaticus]